MRNPFDRTDRGLRHYEQLRSDVEQRSDNILLSLPLFVRIVLTDSSSPWYNEFNRYDLLNPVFVHSDFPSFTRLSEAIEYSSAVHPYPTQIKPMEIHGFLSTTVVKLSGMDYSVQDVVSSIAYSRGLHNSPDREDHKILYTEFMEGFPEVAFQFTLDIATCFVRSFIDVYENFQGRNEAYSPVNGRQPQIVLNGVLVTVAPRKPMMRFSNAWMQLRIHEKPHQGIRFCLELQLIEGSKGVVFQYGHRGNTNISVVCRIAQNIIFIQTLSREATLRKTIRLPLLQQYIDEQILLEVALYSDGQLIVAVNEQLVASEHVQGRFEIKTGKLMIGADLDGKNSAEFYEAALAVESIDQRDTTTRIFTHGLRRFSPFNPIRLSSKAMHRPIQLA